MILTWSDFDTYSKDIARRVYSEYCPDLIVGIAKGGVIFGATLSTILQIDFFPIKLSRRVMEEIISEEPTFHIKPYRYVEGKKVLLVDDITATGNTLKMASRAIVVFKPKELKSATLATSCPPGKESTCRPDFFAIEASSYVIFPWEKEVLLGGELVPNPALVGDEA